MPPSWESWAVDLQGKRVVITHPQRLLWPASAITKGQLVAYYLRVAGHLLPHLSGRPLVLVRCPDGVGGPTFYQKEVPAGAPPWVKTVPVRHGGRTVRYVLAEDAPTLAWLGQMAAVELHGWLSCVAGLNRPDWMVLDLDPEPPSGFEQAKQVALAAREVLGWLGISAVPKLSGGDGLHLCVPLQPDTYTFQQTRSLAARISALLAAVLRDQATDQRPRHRRAGRVYVDPYQNGPGQTLAVPYSPRARPVATVAVPVSWQELDSAHPTHFRVDNVQEWLARGPDPLLQARRHPQRLEQALQRLARLGTGSARSAFAFSGETRRFEPAGAAPETTHPAPGPPP